ncbi:hypothetical protein [Comamonas endophytica]|uniref:DUF2486 family protein n=1 Tax=Comamonas endophytica TaxID=2949090 RepID=A0ABY6G9E5_9BURK|nr:MULTISPECIES: hypothetical protein [unclassified Acidovorax]MCD2511968.1 hypothetical protein [Acidovorax sp. D4N7]UYG51676.1 hypothetical protein M9799_16795 [Acidovorax sp. 5MLIR]
MPKSPPRYVPTLTEVVTEPDAGALAPDVPEDFTGAEPAWAAPPEMGLDLELTKDSDLDLDLALDLGLEPAPAYQAPAIEGSPLAASLRRTLADEGAAQAEEFLVQCLLERVEHGLDERLRETIAHVVHEQTRSFTLRLQEALESVVRQAVQDALAQERELGESGPHR